MIYLDANVFLYAALDEGRKGSWCRGLLGDLVQGTREGVTSALTVDEVTYLVREERGLPASLEAGEALLQTPHLTIAPADGSVLWESLSVMREHELYPRDAIHAATALMRKVRDLYSEDADFDRVPGLRRRWLRG